MNNSENNEGNYFPSFKTQQIINLIDVTYVQQESRTTPENRSTPKN